MLPVSYWSWQISFRSYQYPVIIQSWHSFGHSCRNSFPELRKSCQLWDLTFQPMILTLLPDLPKTWKMLCFPLTLRVDNRSFQNYFVKEKFPQLILWFQTSVLIAFAVSYTEPVEKNWTKTLQNLCCQIELSFIAIYDRETLKLSIDPCQITGIAKS